MHEELIQFAEEIAHYIKWKIEKQGRFKDYLSREAVHFNKYAEIGVPASKRFILEKFKEIYGCTPNDYLKASPAKRKRFTDLKTEALIYDRIAADMESFFCNGSEIFGSACPLLDLLQATINDPNIFGTLNFPEVGCQNEEMEKFRRTAMDIFSDLYNLAVQSWISSHTSYVYIYDDGIAEGTVDKEEQPLGVDLFTLHDGILQRKDVLEGFKRAIRRVAANANEIVIIGRDFMYYMLGILEISWYEHARQNEERTRQMS